MAKINVLVLKDGSYLQENLTAVSASAGDEIEIKAGPYSARIIEWGLVRPVGAAPEITSKTELHEQAAPAVVSEPAAVTAVAEADPVSALMEINGIGQKTAVKFVNGGITSKQAFVTADAVGLSEIAGTTVAKIQTWQAEAARLLEA